jgi:hypothetical protein
MSSFFQIFYAPSLVFTRVKERGSWAAPMVLSALITMVAAYFITHAIGMENLTRRFFDEHPSYAQRMSPAQLQQAIDQSASPARIAMSAGSVGIITVITTLVIALVVMVLLSVSFGISRVVGVSFSRALTLVFVLWLLWVLLRAGVAAAFGF